MRPNFQSKPRSWPSPLSRNQPWMVQVRPIRIYSSDGGSSPDTTDPQVGFEEIGGSAGICAAAGGARCSTQGAVQSVYRHDMKGRQYPACREVRPSGRPGAVLARGNPGSYKCALSLTSISRPLCRTLGFSIKSKPTWRSLATRVRPALDGTSKKWKNPLSTRAAPLKQGFWDARQTEPPGTASHEGPAGRGTT